MRAHFLIAVSLGLLTACKGQPPESVQTQPASEIMAEPKAETEEKVRPQRTQAPSSRLIKQGRYTVDAGRDCDGYPRINLNTPEGLCAGLVATKDTPTTDGTRGLVFPRDILIPDDGDALEQGVLITDMGGWGEFKGRLLSLKAGKLTTLVSNLNLPHAIEYGPDGQIYVAEAHQIIRVRAPSTVNDGYRAEKMIEGLPYKSGGKLHLHPLKAFAFEDKNTIWINSGSMSDKCTSSLARGTCAELGQTAAVLQYVKKADVWSLNPSVSATGLRNSMGLAAHASGTILQVENGTDYKSADIPHEEINVIQHKSLQGRFYGWPYCFGLGQSDPDWAAAQYECSDDNPELVQPAALLPPHGAPLDLLYAQENTLNFDGEKLIVPLHGYRPGGHRIVMVDVDEYGLPAGPLQDLVSGWAADGTKPKGAPVGLSVAPDGSIWGVEDKNKTVFRIAKDRYLPQAWGETHKDTASPLNQKFTWVHDQVLKPRCAECHDEFTGSAREAQTQLLNSGWIGDDAHTNIYERLTAAPPRQMPPDAALPEQDIQAVKEWLDSQ